MELVAAVHGTRDGRDRPTVEALLDRVRQRRPGLPVRAAYLQFSAPSVTSALVEARHAVVVPLLLSTGYHLRVDLPAALTAARGSFALAPALGPHDLLADALISRLVAAGWCSAAGGCGAPIVLAAAGSTDPRSVVDVRRMARLLAQRTRARVAIGFASGASPTVAESVTRLRGDGPVAIASYLIAPGQFHDAVQTAGADIVAGPLADHPALAELVLQRYDAAAPRLAATA